MFRYFGATVVRWDGREKSVKLRREEEGEKDNQTKPDDAEAADGVLTTMKCLLVFLVWCVLLVLCWPLAVLALVLVPLVWLLCLPFRLIGVALEAVIAFVKAVLFLPARLLGYRG